MKKLTLLTLGFAISMFSVQASAHSMHHRHYHKHGKVVIYKTMPKHKHVVKKVYRNHNGNKVIVKKVRNY